MQQQHHQHHTGHEREHVHVHAQHYEEDKTNSRIWLYGGLALLILALIYSAVLLFNAKSKSSAVGNLDVVQMQFDPSHDDMGVAVGSPDAKVTVREFADYQCPACGGFEPVLQQMRKDYVDTGKVRFVFFDYPIEDRHKNSVVAAQFARCAGDQSKYWQMHDALYANQAQWAGMKDPLDTFLGYSGKLGIDGSRMLACIRMGTTHEDVMRSEAYGDALGLHATPTFAVNGEAYVGGVKYQDLKGLIDQQLTAANVSH
ncbi:MAG TPA: DsbA family protein [Gammaproteobacteria bacterium]|nr:DsbA family protein [Gammaproteobacteria bacterium]